jgi:hypothetical protein
MTAPAYRVTAAWRGLRLEPSRPGAIMAGALEAVRASAPRILAPVWDDRTERGTGRRMLEARDGDRGEVVALFVGETADHPRDPHGFANSLLFEVGDAVPDITARAWADDVMAGFLRLPAEWLTLEAGPVPAWAPAPPGVRAGIVTAVLGRPDRAVAGASLRDGGRWTIVTADEASVREVDGALRGAGLLPDLPTLARSGHPAAACPGITPSCEELAIDASTWTRLFRCRWCGTLWKQFEGVSRPIERLDPARAAAEFPSWRT